MGSSGVVSLRSGLLGVSLFEETFVRQFRARSGEKGRRGEEGKGGREGRWEEEGREDDIPKIIAALNADNVDVPWSFESPRAVA